MRAWCFHDADSLREALQALEEAEEGPAPPQAAKIAFAYTGQASQWPGMGAALYASEPAFRAVLDRCDALLRAEREGSLLDVMFGRPGAAGELDDPQWKQPAIYALECALTALWSSIGIRPDVVLGHSLGEIAAAHTAGVFSLEDGLRFAAARGSLIGALPGEGAMAAVFAPAPRVAAALEAHNAASRGIGLCIAADNGAHQVISGPRDEIEAILAGLEAQEVRVARLRQSPAYHSAMIDPALEDLAAVLSGLSFAAPSLTFVSNLTGRVVEGDEGLDAAYWRRQVREPVAFAGCVETLAALGVDAVIELGPHGVLGPMTTLAWPESAGAAAACGAVEPAAAGQGRGAAGAGRRRRLLRGGGRRLRGRARSLLRRPLRGRGAAPHLVARLSLPARALLGRGAEAPPPGRRPPAAGRPARLGERRDRVRHRGLPRGPGVARRPPGLRPADRAGRAYGALAASAGLAEGAPAAVVEDFQMQSALVFPDEDAGAEGGDAGRRVQVLLDGSGEGAARGIQVLSRGESEEG